MRKDLKSIINQNVINCVETKPKKCKGLNVLADLRTDGANECEQIRVASRLSRLVHKHNRRNSASVKQIQDTSYRLNVFKHKAAFTLAEVIITLAIIGIIAAVTLPSLIQSYKKKVASVRVKKAYSTLTQAIKLSEIENGPVSQWNIALSSDGTENTGLVVEKYIRPYINNLQFCDNNSDDDTQKCGAFLSVKGKGYLLPDGTTISFVAGGDSYSVDPLGNNFILTVIIDINAGQKPNKLGYDAFYFQLNKDGFGPWGFNQKEHFSRDDILTGYTNAENLFISCRKSGIDENDDFYRHGCTLLLMLDNWEFKEDYPW